MEKLTSEQVEDYLKSNTTLWCDRNGKMVSPADVLVYIKDLEQKLLKLALRLSDSV